MLEIQFMPKAFYTRFEQLMDENNIHGKTLCRALGVSGSTVSEWRNGRVMTTVNFFTICQYFNVSPSWLYGITDKRSTYAE